MVKSSQDMLFINVDWEENGDYVEGLANTKFLLVKNVIFRVLSRCKDIVFLALFIHNIFAVLKRAEPIINKIIQNLISSKTEL